MVISEAMKEDFMNEAIENIFALLSESDIEFRQAFKTALETMLTSRVEEKLFDVPCSSRYNLLGELVSQVLVSDQITLEQEDQRLISEGYTCLDLQNETPEVPTSSEH